MDDELLPPPPPLTRTATGGGIPVYQGADITITSTTEFNFDKDRPAENKVWLGPTTFDLGGDTFTIDAYLNYGAEGQAYRMRRKSDGRICVGKFCSAKDSPEIDLVQQMPRALVAHPNFLTYQGLVLNVKEKFRFPHHLIVMEHVPNGELFDFIASGEPSVQGKPVSEGTSRRFLQDLISGMAECYRFGITHRDLKPENLLINEQGRIVIIDLGHAKRAACAPLRDTPGEPEPLVRVTTTHKYGTAAFQAPEVADGRACAAGYDCELADVWSVGVVAFYLQAKLPAFKVAGGAALPTDMVGPDNAQFWNKIEKSGWYNKFTTEQKNCINCMWRADPKERPTFASLEKAIARDATALAQYPGLQWLAEDVNDDEAFLSECKRTRPDKKFNLTR
jgi:serine/threonine protein kinase